jgi:protein-disulfide isomerase
MHHRLMTTEQWRRDTNWTGLAKAVGVSNVTEFESCLISEAAILLLERDISLARRLGVEGTPAFFTRTRWREQGVNTVSAMQLISDGPR